MEEITKPRGMTMKESVWCFIETLIIINVAIIPFILVGIIFQHLGLKEARQYIEIIGQTIAYIYVIRRTIKKFKVSEEFKLKLQYKPKISQCICLIFIIMGHDLIYENSIGIILSYIPISSYIESVFNDIFAVPVVAFISVCLIAPIFEEVIFRGIILEQLSKKNNIIKSLLVSSLLFGIMHFNIHQGVHAFFIGLIFGYIYIKTNSLILAMFLHFINNFINFIFSILDVESVLETAVKFNPLELIGGIIILIISFGIFNKIDINPDRKFNFKSREQSLPQ